MNCANDWKFKNMLNRFDPVTAADSSMELEFFYL